MGHRSRRYGYPALAANYADVGGGDFHPTTNYGSESQFNYATSNFISNGFFNTFSYAGDANFRATLQTVPEPASVGLASEHWFVDDGASEESRELDLAARSR